MLNQSTHSSVANSTASTVLEMAGEPFVTRARIDGSEAGDSKHHAFRASLP